MASIRPLAPAIGSADAIADGLQVALAVLRGWACGGRVDEAATAPARRAAAALLAQNRLLALTGHLLLQPAPDPDVSAMITAFRRLTAEMNGANLLLMRRLAVVITDIPVRIVVYKGVVLQSELYGTPFARPSSDVDLLTAPEDYAQVAQALEAAGYRLDPNTDTVWWRRFLAEQQFRWGRDAQSVDLHHRIQQPGCPMPRAPARLIALARPQTFLGAEILTFRPDHALLVAAMSLAKALHHREPAGRYVGDLLWMLRRLPPGDWAGVRAEARMLGLSRTLDLAVRCVAAVFGSGSAPRHRPILEEVADIDLQYMLLAPAHAPTWIRRRRLLGAICDHPADVVSAWFVMAASETVRRASAPRRLRETIQ